MLKVSQNAFCQILVSGANSHILSNPSCLFYDFFRLDFQDKQVFSVWKIDTLQSSTAENQLVLCMSNVNILYIVVSLDHDSDDWLKRNIAEAASNLLAATTT